MAQTVSQVKALGNTVRVSNDDGRAVISFGLVHCFDYLSVIGTESNLSNIDIAVGHGNHAKIFFRQSLTSRSELGRSAHRGCFGLLSAGVGIYAGIHNQNVDIAAGSDGVIQAAEADIISPAVAA